MGWNRGEMRYMWGMPGYRPPLVAVEARIRKIKTSGIGSDSGVLVHFWGGKRGFCGGRLRAGMGACWAVNVGGGDLPSRKRRDQAPALCSGVLREEPWRARADL
jgi:hypothetical protein